MILGAFSVWRGEVDQGANNYANTSLKASFDRYDREGLKNAAEQLLTSEWRDAMLRNQLQYALLWPQIAGYRMYCRVMERKYRVSLPT